MEKEKRKQEVHLGQCVAFMLIDLDSNAVTAPGPWMLQGSVFPSVRWVNSPLLGKVVVRSKCNKEKVECVTHNLAYNK